MSELQTWPRATQLLRELCGWTRADEKLPLELLLNLHRGVLRRPLEALGARQTVTNEREVIHELGQRYPSLIRGYEAEHAALGGLYGAVLQENALKWPKVEPGVRVLLYAANSNWIAAWPAVVLHRLTWPAHQGRLDALLAMLEIMLAVSSETQPMVLALANGATCQPV